VDIGTPTAFQGVATLGNTVLVADYVDEAIQRFSPDGTYLGQFVSVLDPTFIETDSAGNVYMTPVPGASVARRYDSSGTQTGIFSHGDLDQLLGIDADSTGNVYIASNVPMGPDEIFKFAPDGTFLNRVSVGFGGAFDMAIDEAGERLYLADQLDSENGVKVFDISGAAPSLIGSIATPDDSVIVGVHFAAESGNILVSDLGIFNGPRGYEISTGGVLLETYLPLDAAEAWDITTFVPIPEPASAALTVMAVIGIVVCGRFRRS
jgi:DNA-binding beta-propeller fold protein YncE